MLLYYINANPIQSCIFVSIKSHLCLLLFYKCQRNPAIYNLYSKIKEMGYGNIVFEGNWLSPRYIHEPHCNTDTREHQQGSETADEYRCWIGTKSHVRKKNSHTSLLKDLRGVVQNAVDAWELQVAKKKKKQRKTKVSNSFGEVEKWRKTTLSIVWSASGKLIYRSCTSNREAILNHIDLLLLQFYVQRC